MSGTKLFLIGMPGSGKSTLGRQLASRLGYSFVDLDEEIERSEAATVKEIFTVHGEEYFRESERKVLSRLAMEEGNVVIATGGGTPCFYDNMDLIKQWGTSIFLDVPIKELEARLSSSEKEKRPKFSSGDELEKSLQLLLKERMSFYERADHRWGSGMSVEDFIAELRS